MASGSSGAEAGAGGIDRAHSERQPAAAGAATAADVQQVIDFFSSAASAAASAATGEEEEEEEDSAELGDDWVQLGGSNIHLRKHMSKGSMDQVYDPSNLQVTFNFSSFVHHHVIIVSCRFIHRRPFIGASIATSDMDGSQILIRISFIRSDQDE